ncbi:MAG: glycogen synthase [SAR324 cluster bacterium]|nr:glycogen synthase [SAR324 cluster bacterium]
MSKKYKIIFTISECNGFAKTGGLADVGMSLPLALKEHGHDVRIVIPFYRGVSRNYNTITAVHSLGVPMGDHEAWCSVRYLIEEGVPVYFIEHNGFFDRDRIYDDGNYEYGDNAMRFGFLSRAVLQLCKVLHFMPDIIHCNDWQTAMTPYYLKEYERDNYFLSKTASVLTIHNAAFQGKFWGGFAGPLAIAHKDMVSDCFEDFGMINFLKGGIAYADKINAVSPGYAEELTTYVGSHGLHDSFMRRQQDFSGILNGCDYHIWDPEIDHLIPAQFSLDDLSGKKLCKKMLQKSFNLPQLSHTPVIGIVSRLTQQKGFDYTLSAMRDILINNDVQVVILGAGESWIQDALHGLAWEFPEKCGVTIRYSEEVAHYIEAGSDMFLMPSLFEPCGLNQMYSLKYGTLPIVRSVGGLKNTVEHYNILDGSGTGFVFQLPTSGDVVQCVNFALETYHKRPTHFQKMIRQAMQQHFDWRSSTIKYEELYESAIKKRQSGSW